MMRWFKKAKRESLVKSFSLLHRWDVCMVKAMIIVDLRNAGYAICWNKMVQQLKLLKHMAASSGHGDHR